MLGVKLYFISEIISDALGRIPGNTTKRSTVCVPQKAWRHSMCVVK